MENNQKEHKQTEFPLVFGLSVIYFVLFASLCVDHL